MAPTHGDAQEGADALDGKLKERPWRCVQGTEYPPPPALKKELVAVVREVIGPIATRMNPN